MSDPQHETTATNEPAYVYDSDDEDILDLIRAHRHELMFAKLKSDVPLQTPWLSVVLLWIAERQHPWQATFSKDAWDTVRWTLARAGKDAAVVADFTWSAPLAAPLFPHAPPRMTWHGPRYAWSAMLSLHFIDTLRPSLWNFCQNLDDVRAQIAEYTRPLTSLHPEFVPTWYEKRMLEFVQLTGLFPRALQGTLPRGLHGDEDAGEDAGTGYSNHKSSSWNIDDYDRNLAHLEDIFREINSALTTSDESGALKRGERGDCLRCMEQTSVFLYFERIVLQASLQEANRSLPLYVCIFELVHARLEWMVECGADTTAATASASAMASRWHGMREYMDQGAHEARISAIAEGWMCAPRAPEHTGMVVVDDDGECAGVPMEIGHACEDVERRVNARYRCELRAQRLRMTSEFEEHAYKNMHLTVRNKRRLHREWRDFDSCLAFDGLYGNIYVTWSFPAEPSLWRIVITPALGTPYAGGCFSFDMRVLSNYPSTPPIMHFLTTGQGTVRFNPNLYCSGKVCLSLLGTWVGESWNAKVSNLNQLLMSILVMIFVEDPFFNEPGYQKARGTDEGARRSEEYNRTVRYHTLNYAVYEPLRCCRDPQLLQLARTHFNILWEVLHPEYVRWAEEECDPQRREKMYDWIQKSSDILHMH